MDNRVFRWITNGWNMNRSMQNPPPFLGSPRSAAARPETASAELREGIGRFARNSTAEDPIEQMERLGGSEAGRRLRRRANECSQAALHGSSAFAVRKQRRQGCLQGRRRDLPFVGHDGPHLLRARANRGGFVRRRGIRAANPLLAAGRSRFLLRSGHGAATDRIPDQQHHGQDGDGTQHHSVFVPQRRDPFNRNRCGPQ